jgi:hypothetical protein
MGEEDEEGLGLHQGSNAISEVVTEADPTGAPATIVVQSVEQPAGTTQPTGEQTAGSGDSVPTYASASVPMSDFLYQNGIQSLPDKLYKNGVLSGGFEKLGLKLNASGDSKFVINDHKDGASSILINSDRVILNSKTSHTIIAGAQGVSISSPEKVNIDADESITLFAPEGLYLGVPNKGAQRTEGQYPPADLAKNPNFIKEGKKLKSYPTEDAPYEPLVLGYKLINWLDDLLVIIKNMQILTNTGLATPREDAQWDFIALQTRLKELVSTYIYIDGYSHEIPDFASLPKPPTVVTKPKTSIDVNITAVYNQTTSPPTPGPVTSPNSNKPGYYEGTAGPNVQLTTD